MEGTIGLILQQLINAGLLNEDMAEQFAADMASAHAGIELSGEPVEPVEPEDPSPVLQEIAKAIDPLLDGQSSWGKFRQTIAMFEQH